MVGERLAFDSDAGVVQLRNLETDGRPGARDQFKWTVKRLRDLPQRTRPVALGLLWQALLLFDCRDRVGEGWLDQFGGGGGAHWDRSEGHGD